MVLTVTSTQPMGNVHSVSPCLLDLVGTLEWIVRWRNVAIWSAISMSWGSFGASRRARLTSQKEESHVPRWNLLNKQWSFKHIISNCSNKIHYNVHNVQSQARRAWVVHGQKSGLICVRHWIVCLWHFLPTGTVLAHCLPQATLMKKWHGMISIQQACL